MLKTNENRILANIFLHHASNSFKPVSTNDHLTYVITMFALRIRIWNFVNKFLTIIGKNSENVKGTDFTQTKKQNFRKGTVHKV